MDLSKLPPWMRRSKELAEHVMQNFVNRTDVCGRYRDVEHRTAGKSKSYTWPRPEDRGKQQLDVEMLAAHFQANIDKGNVLGIHSADANAMTRFVAVDVDRHSDDIDPETNRRFAVHVYDKARSLGFLPYLVTSDDKGGFHLWIVFSDRVPAAVAHYFGRWLTADHAEHGIKKAPEVFPKSPSLLPGQVGTWLRLPGPHHTKWNLWSKAYNASAFVGGDEAVDLFLAAKGNNPALIPAEAAPPPPQPTPAPVSLDAIADIDEQTRIKRCMAVVNSMPPAIAGQGGHDKTYAVACTCNRYGVSRESARLVLQRYNERCEPLWSEAELHHKLTEAYDKNPHQFGFALIDNGRTATLTERAALLSDIGNAARLVLRFGQDLRYCHAFNKWLVFDGGPWQFDESSRVIELAKQAVLRIADEAKAEVDDTRRSDIFKWAATSQKRERLTAMLDLAKPDLPILPDQLDANPWILPALNGVIELRTGELRPARREDYVTRICPVNYDARAVCPLFLAFLGRIFEGNGRIISFLQRLIGYILTGDTSERCMFILWGSGANGKSTLLAVLRELMGGFASHIRAEVLTVKRGDGGIPNDIARLKGARLVAATEFDEGRKLAEATLKQMTGGEDVLTARFLRAEFFDFKPTFKLLLATNHRPDITGTDAAIWDRIRLLPFKVRFYETEDEAEAECGDSTRIKDKTLIDKLKAELPGILAWAVRGCLAWQREGLGTPSEVVEATDAYRSESDVISEFLSDCCIQAENEQSDSTPLYYAYKQWAERQGCDAVIQKRFGSALRERGFVSFKQGNRRWCGLRLKTAQELGEDGAAVAGAIRYGGR